MAKNYPRTVFGTRSRIPWRIPTFMVMSSHPRATPYWFFNLLTKVERLINPGPWFTRKIW